MPQPAHAVADPNLAAVPWRSIMPRFDQGPGARATLGLLVLATDMATESDMAQLLHLDGVATFVSRMPMSEKADPESLAALEHQLSEATEQLVPWAGFDAVAFGCTTGSIAVGPQRVAERVQAVKPGVPVLNPVDAAGEGLTKLGCQRIAVLSPYVDEVNAMLADYLTGKGFELGACAGFKQAGDPQMNRIDPAQIRDVGAELGSTDCDGLFISCTGLRTAAVVQSIEDRIGKPVVTSNQALAWATLRAAGLDDRPSGYGRLFQVA